MRAHGQGLHGRYGADGQPDGYHAELEAQLEALRDTGSLIRVWGQLRCGVPDAFGSQIEVTRLEVID